MKSIVFFVLALHAALLIPPPAAVVAQDTSRPAPQLKHLVSAKILPGYAPTVIMMINSFRRENLRVKSTTEIFVVQDDGSEKPYSEPTVRTQVQVNRIPAGLKPITTDAKHFKFFDLDWKPVSFEDAAKRLTKLKPVFLLDAGMTAGKFSTLTRSALQNDCMILMTKNNIRKNDGRMRNDPFGGGRFGDDPFN